MSARLAPDEKMIATAAMLLLVVLLAKGCAG